MLACPFGCCQRLGYFLCAPCLANGSGPGFAGVSQVSPRRQWSRGAWQPHLSLSDAKARRFQIRCPARLVLRGSRGLPVVCCRCLATPFLASSRSAISPNVAAGFCFRAARSGSSWGCHSVGGRGRSQSQSLGAAPTPSSRSLPTWEAARAPPGFCRLSLRACQLHSRMKT